MRSMSFFIALLLSNPNLLMACTVCFGNPDAATTKAAKAGILFLLVVTVCVLSAFGLVFLTWMKRAKELDVVS